MATGRMHSFLRGLDEWLLREDPDVCAQAAEEEMAAYGDDDETPDGDEQDAAWDAARDASHAANGSAPAD